MNHFRQNGLPLESVLFENKKLPVKEAVDIRIFSEA